ncbi:MAG: hypothetical protein J5903_02250 [Clostridia bacterium]|nr:hypothetical protein [Clostridia bacterium]
MNAEVLSLAEEIVSSAARELTAKYPYFAYAVGAFSPELSEEVSTVATDGEKIYVSPEHAVLSAADGGDIAGEILHAMLHTLFLHPFACGGEDFSIAADIDVGELLDERFGAFPSADHKLKIRRKSVYKSIKSGFDAFNEKVCEKYLSSLGQEEKEEFKKLFVVCDHELWRREKRVGEDDASAEKRAREIARRVMTSPSTPDDVRARIKVAVSEESGYSRLVRKFLTQKEVLAASDEEFDHIYYCLGLERYGNMPLVEPLEYRDERTLSDVVIAIDTSGSTLGEPIARFVSETYALVESENARRRRFRVRIIQCDSRITSDVTVNSGEEFKKFIGEFGISGGGGTDLRPVFDLLAAEKKSGAKINCIIYFTDGKGVFPDGDCGIKTCFALFGKDAEKIKIPPFAYKAILGE